MDRRQGSPGHLTILLRITLPLMAPAIAASAIIQLVWVWNDLLVDLTGWSCR